MSNFTLLSIILILIIVGVVKTFNPYIDILRIDASSITTKYRVLLWYNYFEGKEIKRRYIKLW